MICGPTATGKSGFAIKAAKIFNGEGVSADSRQVYKDMDVVTGKDIWGGAPPITSLIRWRGRLLQYYLIDGVKVWLYDVVAPDEPFNLAFWGECARLVMNDISKRSLLSIVVGGTGLYIKSLLLPLGDVAVPPRMDLRAKWKDKTPDELLIILNQIDPRRAAQINISDRRNSRRLLRLIEIALAKEKGSNLPIIDPVPGSVLTLGLITLKEKLYGLIDQRVDDRMRANAIEELAGLMKRGYDLNLPSMSSSGYAELMNYYLGKESISQACQKWKNSEHAYARRQLTWFNKQAGVNWYDVSEQDWFERAVGKISQWYNGAGT